MSTAAKMPSLTPGRKACVVRKRGTATGDERRDQACRRLGTNEGLVMVAAPPDALDRYFADEEARWRKVIQDAGIKAE